MKTCLTFSAILLLGLNLFAQNYVWNTAQIIKSVTLTSKSNEPHSLFATEHGVYIFGEIWNNLAIGDTVLFRPGNINQREYYVAKFDHDGTFQWASREGLNAQNIVVSVDQSGNFYVSGRPPTVSFTVGEITLDSAFMYSAKFSPEWEVLKANDIWGWGCTQDNILANVVDAVGNFYLLLGAQTIKLPDYEFTLEWNGACPQKVLLIQYDGGLQYQDVQEINLDIKTANLTVDHLGNIVAAGNTEENGFLLKNNPGSGMLWTEIFSGGATVSDVEINEDNKIIIGGNLEIGETQIGGEIVHAISDDPFFAIFDEFGTLQEVINGPSSTENVQVSDVAFYKDKVVLAGTYDNQEFQQDPGTPADTTDVYVAFYHYNGALGKVMHAYGNCDDRIKQICFTEEKAYVLGSFACNITMQDSTYYVHDIFGNEEDRFYTYLGSFDLVPPPQVIKLQEERIWVYPNPSPGHISVDVSNLPFSNTVDYTLEITDMTGRRLFYDDREQLPLIYTLESLSLPSGIYNLIVRMDQGTFAEQVVFVD